MVCGQEQEWKAEAMAVNLGVEMRVDCRGMVQNPDNYWEVANRVWSRGKHGNLQISADSDGKIQGGALLESSINAVDVVTVK